MNAKVQHLRLATITLLMLASTHLNAAPLGTAFTYQGRLTDGANAANGRYDLVFALYDDAFAGSQLGSAVTNLVVVVSDGLFTVNLDFGANVIAGDARWLAIGVRSNGVAANFTPLNPRQPLTPAPYALFANTASNLAGGSVVKSVNNLKDNVTLAAGTNVTLTPSGNTLTIAAAGVGGSGIWSALNNNAYYDAGKVGIGTSAPTEQLHVNGKFFRIEGAGGEAAYLGGDGVGGEVQIGSLNPGISKVAVYNAANGTWMDTYLGPLTAFGTVNANGDLNVSGRLAAAGPASISGDVEIGNGAPTTGLLNEFLVSGTFNLATLQTQTRLVVKQNGNVGIGVAAPGAKLQIKQSANNGVGVFVGDRSPFGAALFESDVTAPGTHAWFAENGDRVFSVMAGGEGYFKGNASVCALTIRGGCDVAEPFEMSAPKIAKGAVVVIDDENAGKLKLSDQAYDRRVAGIVSGANGINPGIALHQEGAFEGGQNVALSGRVYVQADATGNPIKPGDLLTTSDTPGHAMKVTDHAKAQGAILGKAMSALKEGTGMVLVLVTLQ